MPFPGSGLGTEGGANGIGAGIGVLGADVYLFGSAVAGFVVINTVFNITGNAAVDLFFLLLFLRVQKKMQQNQLFHC